MLTGFSTIKIPVIGEDEKDYSNLFERLIMIFCMYFKIPAMVIMFHNISLKLKNKTNYLLIITLLICKCNNFFKKKPSISRRFLYFNYFFFIQDIMLRSWVPTSSMGCCAPLRRIALKLAWLAWFSRIQFLAKVPS